MADNDQARLSKLLARTLGLGFKLAMIEVVTPRDRAEILQWLEPQLHELNAEPVFVERDPSFVA